jgi:hypothetical protein
MEVDMSDSIDDDFPIELGHLSIADPPARTVLLYLSGMNENTDIRSFVARVLSPLVQGCIHVPIWKAIPGRAWNTLLLHLHAEARVSIEMFGRVAELIYQLSFSVGVVRVFWTAVDSTYTVGILSNELLRSGMTLLGDRFWSLCQNVGTRQNTFIAIDHGQMMYTEQVWTSGAASHWLNQNVRMIQLHNRDHEWRIHMLGKPHYHLGAYWPFRDRMEYLFRLRPFRERKQLPMPP